MSSSPTTCVDEQSGNLLDTVRIECRTLGYSFSNAKTSQGRDCVDIIFAINRMGTACRISFYEGESNGVRFLHALVSLEFCCNSPLLVASISALCVYIQNICYGAERYVLVEKCAEVYHLLSATSVPEEVVQKKSHECIREVITTLRARASAMHTVVVVAQFASQTSPEPAPEERAENKNRVLH